MTRRLDGYYIAKRARARRSEALSRVELRQPSTPHVFASGSKFAPLKAAIDPETRKLIDDALARRSGR